MSPPLLVQDQDDRLAPGKRDRSRASAVERKRRQRDRARKAGAVRVEILIPEQTRAALAWAADLTGGDTKEQAEYLLRCTVAAYRAQLAELAKHAGRVWRDAQPYLAAAHHLTVPGQSFRVHDRTLRSDDWLPIQAELAAIHARLARRGWTKPRIRAFLARCAKEFATTDCDKR